MLDRWFMSGVIHDNYMIWITEIGGHIMKMNLDNYNIEYIHLEGLETYTDFSGSSVFYQEGDISYFFINKGKRLLLYDDKKQSYRFLELGLEKKYLNMIASITKRNDELFVIPMYDNDLIRINIKTGDVECKSIANTSIYSSNEKIPFFAKCNEIDNDVMWLFPTINSQAIKYKMSTGESEYIDIPDVIEQPINVIGYNNEFYLLTLQGDVYCWNDKSNEVKKIIDNPTEQKKDAFSVIHIAHNNLWLLPSYGNDIYVYNMKRNVLKKFELYPDEFKYNAPTCMGKYTYCIKNGSKCYMAMHAGNHIFCIDENTGESEWVDPKWPDEEYTVGYLCSRGKTNFFELEMTLNTYFDYIKKRRIERKENCYGTGEKIWEKCKGM